MQVGTSPECSLVVLVAVIIMVHLCVSDSIEDVGITTDLLSPPIVSTVMPLSPALVPDVDLNDAGRVQ